MTGEDAAEELVKARTDLAVATAQAEELQRALVSSRQIGMAMGILMEGHRLTAEQAFDCLRDLSSGATSSCATLPSRSSTPATPKRAATDATAPNPDQRRRTCTTQGKMTIRPRTRRAKAVPGRGKCMPGRRG